MTTHAALRAAQHQQVRTADVLLRVEDAVTLAGLVRALVETAAGEADAGPEARVTDRIHALLTRRTGAELQRRVHRETGDLRAVVRTAVALTAGADAAEPDAGGSR